MATALQQCRRRNNHKLVQRSPFMTAFMLAAAIIGPAMWILSGTGLATREIIDDFCGMMSRHIDGDLNPWVLEEARCAELLEAGDSIQELMEASNAPVVEANEDLTGARPPRIFARLSAPCMRERNEGAFEGTLMCRTGQLTHTALLRPGAHCRGVGCACLRSSAVRAEANDGAALVATFTGGDAPEPLPLLCVPFADDGSGMLVQNPMPAPGCVPLEPMQVNASYVDAVCPTPLPDELDTSDPAFLVRHLVSPRRVQITTTRPDHGYPLSGTTCRCTAPLVHPSPRLCVSCRLSPVKVPRLHCLAPRCSQRGARAITLQAARDACIRLPGLLACL